MATVEGSRVGWDCSCSVPMPRRMLRMVVSVSTVCWRHLHWERSRPHADAMSRCSAGWRRGQYLPAAELEAHHGDVSVLGEGKANVADTPGLRGQRKLGHIAVMRSQQRGARGTHTRGAGAIDHGVDLLGGRHVGDGNEVIAELGDAQIFAIDGHGVNVDACVVLARAGSGGEVFCKALAVETPTKTSEV